MDSFNAHRIGGDCPHCDGAPPPRFYLAPTIATESHGLFLLALAQLALMCVALAFATLAGWAFVVAGRVLSRVLLRASAAMLPHDSLGHVCDWCCRWGNRIAQRVG